VELLGQANAQMPPGDWFVWLLLAGRGFGKTRTATENISRLVRGPTPLIAPPGAPLRRRRRVRRAHLDGAPIQAARLASAAAFRSASTR
jgi:phage terminase large subunit-like protein